jgi:signal peptidase I
MEFNIKKWYQSYKRKKAQKKPPETFNEYVVSWVKTILGAIIVVMILNGLAIASFVVPTPSMENTVMTGDFLFVDKFRFGPTTPQLIPFVNVPLPFYKFPGIKKPQKGDVIVFIFPGNRDEVKSSEFQYYLKRCVAEAGDTLQVIDNKLYVNGKYFPLSKDGKYDSTVIDPIDKWRTFPYGRNYTHSNYGPIVIPKKGDVIHLNQQNLAEWFIFISREGHKITTSGQDIIIDDKVTTSYTVEKDYVFGMGDNRDHSLDSRYWGYIPVDNVVGTPLMVYWSWDTNLPMGKFFSKFSTIRWNRIFHLIH